MTVSVRANTIIPTWVGTGGPVLGEYTWRYSVNLTGVPTASQIVKDDFFTIKDVNGLDEVATAALILPANWTVSFEDQTTDYLNGIAGSDLITKRNVRWTYTGATAIVSPTNLGIFRLVSTLHNIALTNYSGNDHDTTTGIGRPLPQNNTGLVEAPSATGPDAVPLPMTAGAGFVLLGLFGHSRVRRTQTT